MSAYDLFHADKTDGEKYCKSFLLWPKQWSSYDWNSAIDWKSIQATKDNIAKLPEKSGVYIFAICPNIADAEFFRIIAYIGETKGATQSLRKRCAKYFQKSEHEKRPHIGEMMGLWPKNLRIYYTTIADSKAKLLEDQLLKAFLPPYNRKFPGSFNKLALNIYHS